MSWAGGATTTRDGAGVESVETVGGVRIRVSIAGAGPPLLLLPGIGSSIELWQPLRRRLTGRTTIAFDQPGIGCSATGTGFWSVGRVAKLAAAVVDRWSPDVTPDVLGYSFGGLVAQHLARLRVVRRLVLVATTAGQPAIPPLPHRLLAMLQPGILASGERPGAANELGRLFGGPSSRDPRVLVDALAHLAAAPPTVLGYYGQAMAASVWTGLPWVRLLRMPALVVAGGDDRLVPPANSRLLAGLLHRAELQVLPGAGHLLVLDDADRVAAAVEPFLAG